MAKKNFTKGVEKLVQNTSFKNKIDNENEENLKKTSFDADKNLLKELKIWCTQNEINMNKYFNEYMDKAINDKNYIRQVATIITNEKDVKNQNVILGKKSYTTTDTKMIDFKVALQKYEISIREYFTYCIEKTLNK